MSAPCCATDYVHGNVIADARDCDHWYVAPTPQISLVIHGLRKMMDHENDVSFDILR